METKHIRQILKYVSAMKNDTKVISVLVSANKELEDIEKFFDNNNKSIYTLKEHETIDIENMRITRVVNGFVYRFWTDKEKGFDNSVFVPF